MVALLLAMALATQQDEQTLAPPAHIWLEHHGWNEEWDPVVVEQQVWSNCGIDSAFYSLEREKDGRARVQTSPDVTADQRDCAGKILIASRIQDRDQEERSFNSDRQDQTPH